VTAPSVCRSRPSQCLRGIAANTSVRGAASRRIHAVPMPSSECSRALSVRSAQSFLTLDLSSALWCAKINFVEGGTAVGTRLRAGRTASFNNGPPQSKVNCFGSFISGGRRRLPLADGSLLTASFHPFCRAERFLLDFLEISAVACSEAFIEVPVRPRCPKRVASREHCARGEAKDRESGCGQ
jgi:hypothetical protein